MVNLRQNVKEERENIFRYMSIQYTVNFDIKHSVFNYAALVYLYTSLQQETSQPHFSVQTQNTLKLK